MPKPDSILNDVIAGRVDQVLSAISQMQNGVSLRSGHKGKERQGTSSTPIAKRRKACVVGEDKSVGVRDCVRACVRVLVVICWLTTSMWVLYCVASSGCCKFVQVSTSAEYIYAHVYIRMYVCHILWVCGLVVIHVCMYLPYVANCS